MNTIKESIMEKTDMPSKKTRPNVMSRKPGGGRKKVYSYDDMRNVSLRIPSSFCDYLADLGKGVMSRGLIELIEQEKAREAEKKEDVFSAALKSNKSEPVMNINL